jgi:sugar phosphate isomerase/epimerase
VKRLGRLVHQAAAKDTRINEEDRRIVGVLDDRSRPVPAGQPVTGLGGRYVVTRWPQAPAWEFVAVGRGHDVDWWATFLAALAAVDPDTAVNIEHEDAELSGVAGLAQAAEALRAAGAKAGV